MLFKSQLNYYCPKELFVFMDSWPDPQQTDQRVDKESGVSKEHLSFYITAFSHHWFNLADHLVSCFKLPALYAK